MVESTTAKTLEGREPEPEKTSLKADLSRDILTLEYNQQI